MTDVSATAVCDIHSVGYTKVPTNYLSVAEAAISNVQVSQLHALNLCGSFIALTRQELRAIQARHEVVYTSFEIKCKKKISGSTYSLEVELASLRRVARGYFLRYDFTVDVGAHTGSFLGFIPTSTSH